jgi:cytoskeletal protein RodZ
LLAFYQVDPGIYLDAWDTDHIIKNETDLTSAERLPDGAPLQEDDPLIPPISDDLTTLTQDDDSQTAREIFSDIGKELATRRIQLDLDLSEIEDFTHIKDHNISFLEKGTFDQIPSPVQARGMLKIYAEFLELDQRELLKQYAEGLRKKRAEQLALEQLPANTNPVVRFKKNNFLSSILTPDFLVVGGVVLALFIAIIWGSSYVVTLKQAADWEKMGIDRDIIAQNNATPSPSMTSTSERIIETAIAGSGIVVPAENGTDEVPNDAPLQLNISAQQRAWVQISADDNIVFEGRIIPGNPYNYSANNQFVLITGNGAALQILYNNQYIGTLGRTGELVEMVFTKDGLATPTPLYSPTPSATMQPSATPTITATVATPTVTPFIP